MAALLRQWQPSQTLARQLRIIDNRGMQCLVISNGMGEDTVAAHLAAQLQAHDVQCLGFPLVGIGHPYRNLGIPIVGPQLELPSGGFNTHSRDAFRNDLKAGLGQLLIQQYRYLKTTTADHIVSVGDLLPVLAGAIAGKPQTFIGVNKSDYYHSRGYSYLGIELAFLKAIKARIFPRDEKTHQRLLRSGLQSSYLGNPMMDTFIPGSPRQEWITMLPGSREEAKNNLAMMLKVVAELHARAPHFHFEIALAPSLGNLSYEGWECTAEALRQGDLEVTISHDFGAALGHASLVLGMAGTANEQAIGLGKPVIAWPGEGPQYTERFAKLQSQLLGEGLQLMDYHPQDIAARILATLKDTDYLATLPRIGIERMGTAGATERMVSELLTTLGPH